MPETSTYNRIVLKLSGEALAGDEGFGINPVVIKNIAEQVADAKELGVEIAVIVGGGNIWRGKIGSDLGMDRGTADYMGMLATVMNSLALQDSLEQLGHETRVLTSIEMKQVAEPYIRRRAIRYLETGRIASFAVCIGNPYFTKDTTSALRSAEIDADVILMGKYNVERDYSADPKHESSAVKYDKLTYIEMLNENLQVMDATGSTFCMDNVI